MSNGQDIFIVAGARTAIGTFGGALASFRPAELGAIVIREAIDRAGVTGADVQNVVIGTVVPTQPKDAYVSRVAAVNAGIPTDAPAMNVNRLCGSGLQAIVSAAQAIALGEHDVAVAGGAESMSNAPHMVLSARNGQKMGNIEMVDAMLGALHDPFENIHMGVTAENVAAEHGIGRQAQDEFALESQRRAASAIAAGHFRDQIVPIEVKTRQGVAVFDTDEHPKQTDLDRLASLKPVFRKEGTVTAGNASGINDGAAALVLARADAARAAGLTPRARILGYAVAGVRPDVMGIGPIPAVRALLARTGLKVADFDVIESNEAFAAQALAVNEGLGLDPGRVNPNGGAIALGHPVGATGAILTVKALSELDRTGGAKALITMCIGGGQGIAIAIERM